MRRFTDHAGEIYHNRVVAGRGTWHKPPNGHGHWSWKWRCQECGAEGEAATLSQIKYNGHPCPGKKRTGCSGPVKDLVERYVPPHKVRDRSKLCGKQCYGCGHYDSSVPACLYILDTGRARPKVGDLRKDPCPVRDAKYTRPVTTMKVGVVIGKGGERQ